MAVSSVVCSPRSGSCRHAALRRPQASARSSLVADPPAAVPLAWRHAYISRCTRGSSSRPMPAARPLGTLTGGPRTRRRACAAVRQPRPAGSTRGCSTRCIAPRSSSSVGCSTTRRDAEVGDRLPATSTRRRHPHRSAWRCPPPASAGAPRSWCSSSARPRRRAAPSADYRTGVAADWSCSCGCTPSARTAARRDRVIGGVAARRAVADRALGSGMPDLEPVRLVVHRRAVRGRVCRSARRCGTAGAYWQQLEARAEALETRARPRKRAGPSPTSACGSRRSCTTWSPTRWA